MTSPDAKPGYLALFPPGYDWPNRFLPRGTMSLPLQRPYKKAGRVSVPLLVQVLTDDVVTPPEPARKAAAARAEGGADRVPGRPLRHLRRRDVRARGQRPDRLPQAGLCSRDADRSRRRHAAELRQDGAGHRRGARALRARGVGGRPHRPALRPGDVGDLLRGARGPRARPHARGRLRARTPRRPRA